MNRIPVKSSNIRSIGFDKSILEIEFTSSGVYQYFNVPVEIYRSFLNASSKGKYFDQFIKNRYNWTQIE